jgi:hypothetical protein
MNKLDTIQYLSDIHADIRRAIAQGNAVLFEQHIARLSRQRDERGMFAKLFEFFASTPLRELPAATIRLWRGDISAWGASLDAPIGKSGETTLLFAARRGEWDFASRLLDLGCDPTRADIKGISTVDHFRHLFGRQEKRVNALFGKRQSSQAFDALCERLLISPAAQAQQEKRILAETIDYDLEHEATSPPPRASKRL